MRELAYSDREMVSPSQCIWRYYAFAPPVRLGIEHDVSSPPIPVNCAVCAEHVFPSLGGYSSFSVGGSSYANSPIEYTDATQRLPMLEQAFKVI